MIYQGFLKYDRDEMEYYVQFDLDSQVKVLYGGIQVPGYDICKQNTDGMCPLELLNWEDFHRAALDNALVRYYNGSNNNVGCGSCKP